MSKLDLVSPKESGERLRIARELAKLTQKDASEKIGIARTTLVAIEKGERRVKFDELRNFAKIYGTSINALLRSESVHVDLTPRFRKLDNSASDAVLSAAKLLSDLAKAEVELENLLGIQRRKNYPPERQILPGDIRIQAEHDAQELRERLGLGIGPIPDIVTLLELELDVRVYVRRIDGKISGIFAYDDLIGPCILLNANHPRERRSQSAAHECGHYISTRREPEVLHADEIDNSREERYANAFGRALLTPARSVMQKFRDVTAGSERLTRRHVIILAHFFGVSREAMVRRLEELGLIKSGTWDWFSANGGITDEQAKQVLGDLNIPDLQKNDADRPTTIRLNMLAAEVYRKEILSEAQLSRLLQISFVELRNILGKIDAEGDEADGAPKLLG